MHLNRKEVMFFTRQMVSLLSAGLPFAEALESLVDSATSENQRQYMQEFYLGAMAGRTVYSLFAERSREFPPVYLAMVKAGDESGTLPEAMSRVATMLDRQNKTRQMATSAMTYPAIVVVITIGVFIIMLEKVIPVFAHLYHSAHMKLPAITESVLDLSSILRHDGILLLALILGMTGAFHAYFNRSSGGIYLRDRVLLRMPIIGPLLQATIMARIAALLAGLYKAGVPIVEALQLAANAAGNALFQIALEDAAESVMMGQTISAAMIEASPDNTFSKVFFQMLKSGEATGRIDEMMNNMSTFYTEAAERSSERIKALVEPVMLVIMGVLVTYFLIAMYMPMLDMGKAVLKQG
ncbi:type II secretion system F family protein [Acidithiobacillus ferrivorans]|nr:type II secretion system F family protein [Acidithiobacillus ferrivorans]